MSVKSIIILWVQTLFIQATSTRCDGSINSYGYTASWGEAPITEATCSWGSYPSTFVIDWTYEPASTLAASNGPGLAISSASYVVPSGVSIISENSYEGALAAGGAMPFLGTTVLEGALPAAGMGAIAYSCGNGALGIIAEDMGGYGFTEMTTLGYGAGIPGPVVYGSGIGYGPNGYGIF